MDKPNHRSRRGGTDAEPRTQRTRPAQAQPKHRSLTWLHLSSTGQTPLIHDLLEGGCNPLGCSAQQIVHEVRVPSEDGDHLPALAAAGTVAQNPAAPEAIRTGELLVARHGTAGINPTFQNPSTWWVLVPNVGFSRLSIAACPSHPHCRASSQILHCCSIVGTMSHVSHLQTSS